MESYSGRLEEVGAGYTFFCMRQPVGQPRQAEIGFAIRTALISQLEQRPQGLSPRLMIMKLHLKRGRRSLNVGRSTSRLSLTNRPALIKRFYQRSRNGYWRLVWMKYQQQLRSKKP